MLVFAVFNVIIECNMKNIMNVSYPHKIKFLILSNPAFPNNNQYGDISNNIIIINLF